jgi:UDP-N-acetylmuramoylalanine--D-glutamate ligase
LRAAGRRLSTVSITDRDLPDGIVLDGTRLVRRVAGVSSPIADLAGIAALRGRHNGQNAAAAVAALDAENADVARLQAALKSFPGLPHRLEEVGREGRVLFVNDSKATNADAAEKALLSFDRIYWILGGRAKAGGIEPLRPLFGRIVKAYLVGEATEAFAATLEGNVPYERCGTLDRALAHAAADAAEDAAENPVVLLSPACASFDQYPDFEKRGDHFRAIVQAHLNRAAADVKEA